MCGGGDMCVWKAWEQFPGVIDEGEEEEGGGETMQQMVRALLPLSYNTRSSLYPWQLFPVRGCVNSFKKLPISAI